MFAYAVALGLASTLGIHSPDSIAVFTAALQPDPTGRASSANGVATVDLVMGKVQYNVSIASTPHITNVALVDRGRSIEFYDQRDTKGDELQIRGTLNPSQLHGMAPAQLLHDLRAGAVTVMVFTTGEPGGAASGVLKPSANIG